MKLMGADTGVILETKRRQELPPLPLCALFLCMFQDADLYAPVLLSTGFSGIACYRLALAIADGGHP